MPPAKKYTVKLPADLAAACEAAALAAGMPIAAWIRNVAAGIPKPRTQEIEL